MTWKCIHKSLIFVAGGGVKCVHNGLLYSIHWVFIKTATAICDPLCRAAGKTLQICELSDTIVRTPPAAPYVHAKIARTILKLHRRGGLRRTFNSVSVPVCTREVNRRDEQIE